jgi:iron(III) transport system ATP-binding protein
MCAPELEAVVIKVSELYKRFETGKRAGFTAVNGISFDVAEGELVTLLGPSGCGKTTTLRLLAGLEKAQGGSIHIDDECMYAADTQQFRPTHRRPIGMVFQSYAIWPHMTVAGNVAFPLKIAKDKLSKREINERVRGVLDLVGLGDLGERMATSLSGGQQQRVALARALVREPKVLLLDEPLSNLDAELRERMRDEIREVQQRLRITTVFVTHDQSEALAMSDNVIVMNAGQVVETGAPQEIYAQPRHSFTAKFLGVSNTVEGVVSQVDGEVSTVDTALGTLRCRGQEGTSLGDSVLLAVRPDSVCLSQVRPAEGLTLAGRIRLATYHGDSWMYVVDMDGWSVKVKAGHEKAAFRFGDEVFVNVPDGAAFITLDKDEGASESGQAAADPVPAG